MRERKYFSSDDISLSYLDYGGSGDCIIALHGHFGCANTYDLLAKSLCGKYHFISLDQRGHGWSGTNGHFSRNDYLDDISRLYRELGIECAVLVGHSLGGVNAYQYAARNPDRVKALVIEDIGTKIDDDLSWLEDWPQSFASFREIITFLASQSLADDSNFYENLIETDGGWRFRFRYHDLITSQRQLNGDWMNDWMSIRCPILLMRGEKSTISKKSNIEEMAGKNHSVGLLVYPECGHTIRNDNPEKYCEDIKQFLYTLES